MVKYELWTIYVQKLVTLPINESHNLVDVTFNNNDPPNQGAIDSGTKFSNSVEQEGQRQHYESTTTQTTRSQVTFANPIAQPEPPQQPNQLRNKLKGLYNNAVQEVTDACMIADSLLIKLDEAAETILALIGGTDTSADVPTTFQEAWYHPDPIKQKL